MFATRRILGAIGVPRVAVAVEIEAEVDDAGFVVVEAVILVVFAATGVDVIVFTNVAKMAVRPVMTLVVDTIA